MLVLAIFPQLLVWFAALVGIYEPTNALFAFVIFCVIMILISLTAIASKLNEKSKQVIQAVALIEKRVRDLEERENKPQQSVYDNDTGDAPCMSEALTKAGGRNRTATEMDSQTVSSIK